MDSPKALPKYLQIRDFVREKIQTGEFAVGDRIPGEAELMTRFGVSRIVAVNALNRLADEGLIVRRPGKGSFVAESARRAPVLAEFERPAVREIGLILPSVPDDYAVSLVASLRREAQKRELLCGIWCTDGHPETETLLLKHLLFKGVEGILLFPTDRETYDRDLFRLARSEFPLVLLDRDLPGLGTDCVQTDNRLAGRMAVRLLTQAGHKRIAVCARGPAAVSSLTARTEGYMAEMLDSGLPVDPALVLTGMSDDEHDRRLDQLIRERGATALICLNGETYRRAAERMKKHGRTCPDDFSLITVDKPDAVDDRFPPPAHILQDTAAIARHALELLTAEGEGPRKIFVPPVPVPGRSVAPPRPASR